MRLPDFLIVGAMRAGTTTLARDLDRHPDLFLPARKEPDALADEAVFSPAGNAAYARLFAPARAEQRCGEASTSYTKRPTVDGVAARARRLLGDGLKLIYLVREPIARLRSQHHHEVSLKELHLPLAQAVHAHPHLLDYSRYAMQLAPWLEVFGPERIAVVRFERYVAERRETVAALCRFLAVDPARLPALADEVAFNRGANRPTPNPLWRTFVHGTSWYEVYVKPRIPYGTRRWLADRLLPRAPAQADALDPATTSYLVDALAEDTAQFERLYRERWSERYDPALAYDLRARYGEAEVA